MPTPIISVENLSKRYLVGHRAEHGGHHSYTALRDVIGRELRNAVRKALDVARGRQVVQGDSVEEFWALRDVSFEVQEGEVLGIIGRNGAGKSTLLKILSCITEPTSGRVILRGRVASLLEVGTGFHPELTGRENIYLNGAILGMRRVEIRKKFDEIVAFAEVDKFLDTPVKHYSSGMYVRLAFAIAAHLEPEILVVDEVLAVGDVEFQKKCLGKMDEVARRGRTVLFVSHNMAAIERLSSQSLLIREGRLHAHGDTSSVVKAFLRSATGPSVEWKDVENSPRIYRGTGAALISKVRLCDAEKVPYGGEVRFDIVAKVVDGIDFICVSFTISELTGAPVGSGFSNQVAVSKGEGYISLMITIPDIRLAAGQYSISVGIGRDDYKSGSSGYDAVLECMYFIVEPELGRDGMLPHWNRVWGSLIFDGVRAVSLDSRRIGALEQNEREQIGFS
jgi:lipopolysaccharide transport system ATP-binding protein